MKFDPEIIANELGKNYSVFQSILFSLPEEMIQWKPTPEKWNLLEVICHLFDEEREDFRARVQHTLTHPELAMPSIDPAGWVLARNYAAQNFEESLENFLKERKQSLVWLNSLSQANWDSAYQHPTHGALTAKFFLSNWLAHDYLHIRQILAIKHGFLKVVSEVPLDYAGLW